MHWLGDLVTQLCSSTSISVLEWQSVIKSNHVQGGGYYDSGVSFVKYTYPIATTTALLSWGLLAFSQVQASLLTPLLTPLRPQPAPPLHA